MFTSAGGKTCNSLPAKQLMNKCITIQVQVKKTIPGKSFIKYDTQKKSGRRSSILHLKLKDRAGYKSRHFYKKQNKMQSSNKESHENRNIYRSEWRGVCERLKLHWNCERLIYKLRHIKRQYNNRYTLSMTQLATRRQSHSSCKKLHSFWIQTNSHSVVLAIHIKKASCIKYVIIRSVFLSN